MKASMRSDRRRVVRSAGIALAMVMAFGAMTSASALSFGSNSSPLQAFYNGVSYADGQGTVTRSGFNDVITTAKAKDPVVNSGAAFVHERAFNGTGSFGAKSARRTASSWAAVAINDFYITGGSAGYYFYGKVCEDVSGRPDICSKEKSGSS